MTKVVIEVFQRLQIGDFTKAFLGSIPDVVMKFDLQNIPCLLIAASNSGEFTSILQCELTRTRRLVYTLDQVSRIKITLGSMDVSSITNASHAEYTMIFPTTKDQVIIKRYVRRILNQTSGSYLFLR